MGGINSNRWQGYHRKLTVEECRVITVPRLREMRSILSYNLMEEDEYQGSITEIVTVCGNSEFANFTFTFSQQRLGGYRFWFLCAGCAKRAFKMYLPPGEKEYLCRDCYDLTYKSSQGR